MTTASGWLALVLTLSLLGQTQEAGASGNKPSASPANATPTPTPTREFSVREGQAFLDGKPFAMWGLRCGNALHSPAVTQRHIRGLDEMAAHGINTVGVYVQGSNGGFPNPDAGFNGFTRDGHLKPEAAERLEALIRAADKRGMVIMVGLFSPRKDQMFYDEQAIRLAVEETAGFLVLRGLKNVFVDLMHEYNHAERIDHAIFREPGGAEKKALLARWFKAVAPKIPVGVCPSEKSGTGETFAGMDVWIIQKSMPIPNDKHQFVVNVESTRRDFYENDGLFSPSDIRDIQEECERYRVAGHAGYLFHAAFIQGVGNGGGSAPHAEPGGYGQMVTDRGVRFYYDWVRDHVGRWEFPRHVKP